MKLRPFTDGDWPQFVAFAERHFGPSHLTDRSFNEHWFRRGEWTVRVLEDEGTISGMMMTIVVPAKFGETETELAWISSAAVERQVQQRGGGAALYVWAYRSFPLVGAMSSNEDSFPINAVMAQDIEGVAMRRYVWVHDARAERLCLPAGRATVRAAVRRAPTPAGRPTTFWTDDLPVGYDALWERVRTGLFCTTERRRPYMEWRYRSAPHVRYRLLGVGSETDLHALAVVRVQSTSEGSVVRVVDFIADDRWATFAWQAVAHEAADSGAMFTDFMVIGSWQDEHLREAGFLPADATTGLDALPHLLSPVEHRRWSNTFHLGGRLARVPDAWRHHAAVYFTKGDSDRDWPTTYDLCGTLASRA